MVYTPFARTAESIGAENVDLDRSWEQASPSQSSGGQEPRTRPHICILALQEKRQQRKGSRSLLRFDHVITRV
jgi:hypothetical protein